LLPLEAGFSKLRGALRWLRSISKSVTTLVLGIVIGKSQIRDINQPVLRQAAGAAHEIRSAAKAGPSPPQK
jgi:hypothetical protein